MHREQRAALALAERHIEQLVILLRRQGLEEDVALAAVRGVPNIEVKAATRKIDELFDELVERQIARRPRKIQFDKDDPKDKTYPGHPEFMPNVTTKSVFNAHMAQAATPYVLAVANKVAEERGLDRPDKRTIEKVMSKVDWTRAAYEMKGMQPRPPRGKVIKFLDKWIFDPIDKALDNVFIKRVWPVMTAVQTPLLIFAALSLHMKRLEVPARALGKVSAKGLERAGRQSFFKSVKSPKTTGYFLRSLRRAAKWV